MSSFYSKHCLLASVMGMFVYLKLGISFILAFVGGKMIATAAGLHIPIQISLLVFFASLALAITASLFIGRKQVKQTVSVENN